MSTTTPRTNSILGGGWVPADPSGRPSQRSAPTRPPLGSVPGSARPAAWTRSGFWLLELLILAISLVRLAVVVHFGLSTTAPAVEYSTVLLFVFPVAVAGLAYGLQGAVPTCCWVLVLSIPRIAEAIGQRQPSAAATEGIQLTVVIAVGIAAGWTIGAERRERRAAERAQADSVHAEAFYRDLFDSNVSPILLIDGNGIVVEANATAVSVFGMRAQSQLPSGPDSDVTGRPPLRLIDVIGANAAGDILAGLLSATIIRRDPPDGPDVTPADERPADASLPPVEISVDGQPALYRPTATMLLDSDDARRMQVVLQDVTEERRRRHLVETFAAHVVLGQEEERRRISQELHDGPLQSLIHLCRQIDILGRPVPSSDPPIVQSRGLREMVEAAVSEIRAIARGLRPSVLDDLGLVASIGQLLADAERRHHFESSFGVTGPPRRLPSDVELAVFRIAQESLSNVERHAAAHTVAVGLDFEDGGLRLLVKDDGIGFDPVTERKASANQSLGIPGMAERANLIGARLQVHSCPGTGTAIDVRIPPSILSGQDK